jgi:hypothetical protein
MNRKIQTSYGFQIQSSNKKQFDQLCAVSKGKELLNFGVTCLENDLRN